MSSSIKEDTSNPRKPGSDKWVRRFSRSKPGKCYFFNVTTGVSSWKCPEGFVPESSEGTATRKESSQLKTTSNSSSVLSQTNPSSSSLKTNTSRKRRFEEPKPFVHEDSKQNNLKRAAKDTQKDLTVKNIDNKITPEIQRLSDQHTVCHSTQSSNISDGNDVCQVPQGATGGTPKKNSRRKASKRAPSVNVVESGSHSEKRLQTPAFVNSSIKSEGTCDKPKKICNDVSSSNSNEKSLYRTETCSTRYVSGKGDAISQNIDSTHVKLPAQSRLKRLQQSLKSKQQIQEQCKNSSDLIQTSKAVQNLVRSVDGQKFIHEEISKGTLVREKDSPREARKALQCSSSALIVPSSSTVRPAEKRLQKLQSDLTRHQKGTSYLQSSIIRKDSEVLQDTAMEEAMEIEMMESEVLSDIGVLRQREDAVLFTEQPTFMDVDIDFPSPQFDLKSACHIVLDTNILLSHLKFVEGLRDTSLPGKGQVHLFVPWQVLQELDHLKDKGNERIQHLARSAIRYLHENLSSKHPRVCGQKRSDAMQLSHGCPDDNILQSCIQLKDRGYEVILLSNDMNLRNKCLVSEVAAESKDQLLRQLQGNLKILSCSSPDNSKTADGSGGSKDATSSISNDIILCEMKAIIKETLSEVVSRGMEEEYKHLWQKRTIITPPWEVDEVLHCLSYHWLAVCGDFLPAPIKASIEQLKAFFNGKAKRYGLSNGDLKESFSLTKDVFRSIPGKFSKVIDAAFKKLEALQIRLDTVKPALSPKLQVSDDKRVLVLSCFEEAHNAAQNHCYHTILSDPDWKMKVTLMIGAVQTLIHLLSLLLSKPVESISKDDPLVTELVNLIKGGRNITPEDFCNFYKEDSNRILLENGINQFTSFEAQLTSMLQSNA